MTYAVGSADWIAERRSYIGASEAAAALGLSPWSDPVKLAFEKWGEQEPDDETFRMKLGTLIEPIIGQLYTEATGTKVKRVSGPVRHRDHPFIASNPDFRIVGQRALVQAKLKLDQPFGEPDDGQGLGIPLHYRLQGFVELATTGLDRVDFVTLDPRKGVEIFPVRFDMNRDEIFDVVLDLVDYWRNYIEPHEIPPPTSASGSAILRRHPEADVFGKVASTEQEPKLQELLDAKAAADLATAEFERLKNEAKLMIGDAAFIEGLGMKFGWSRWPKKTVAWKNVAESYGRALREIRAWMHTDAAPMDPVLLAFIENLDVVESLQTTESIGNRFTISESK